MTTTRGAAREEPFAADLARPEADPRRRTVQRGIHQILFRLRRMGHPDLAGWLAEGFRLGTMTDDFVGADPKRVARTLAAIHLYHLVESVEEATVPRYGTAALIFEAADTAEGEAAEPAVSELDLGGIAPGRLRTMLLAAASGLGGGVWRHLRYLVVDEMAPDSGRAGEPGTLDAWDTLPGSERRLSIPPRALFRVRFAWRGGDGHVHLSRFEQPLRHVGEQGPTARHKRADGGTPRLALPQPGVVLPAPADRRVLDRWDRAMLDSFVANEVTGELALQAGTRG